MASLSEIEAAGADLLADLFPGRALVRGWFGESPAPAGPFVYYRAQVSAFSDIPPVKLSTDGATQTVRHDATTVAFEVSFNGGQAYAHAFELVQSLWLSQRAFDLLKVCGFMGATAPRDLSELHMGSTQTRADVTLNLSASVTLTREAETIGSVAVRTVEAPHAFDHTLTISEGSPP